MISIVLVAPSRGGAPTTFSDEMDTLLSQLPTWTTQANALEANVNAKEVTVTASAAQVAIDLAAVQAAASQIITSSNAPLWVSGSNYAVGDYRTSPADRRQYKCYTTATGRTTDPSLDTGFWQLWSVERPILQVVGTSQTMVAGFDYKTSTGAANTFTLPASPIDGDPPIRIWMTNGRTDNTINPGSNTINGVAGTLNYDISYSHPIFRFIGTSWTFSPY